MTSISATQARQNLFRLVSQSIKGHIPIRITSKFGAALLISEEDYGSLIETLELLSTRGFMKKFKKARADIKAGRTKSLKEVFGH